MPQLAAVFVIDKCWGNPRFFDGTGGIAADEAWVCRVGRSRWWGNWRVNKLATAIALCCSLICSPVHAKTFVGVLWPMFGPAPAIGLVELVAELKLMSGVEVSTYLHQSWPSLVEDINRQAPGTHTVVVGYSLGANSSVFVANSAKYVDLIIALQPSMLSWNPPVTGKVGRMIEIYNPNPWMTFGGMGSKKLIGENIEYIANYDSHPGAQFNSDFRNLVKNEIAKITANDRLETAQAAVSRPNKLAQLPQSATLKPAKERLTHQQRDLAAKDHLQIAQAEAPKLQKQTKSGQVTEEQQKQQQRQSTAFLDTLSSSANAGYLLVQRRLTVSDMKDYAQRRLTISDITDHIQRPLTIEDMKDYAEKSYHGSNTAELMTTASD
jgi:hypothetical protein